MPNLVADYLLILTATTMRQVMITRCKLVGKRWREVQAASPDNLVIHAWAGGYGHFRDPLVTMLQAHWNHHEWYNTEALTLIEKHVPPVEHNALWAESAVLKRWLEETFP